MKEKQNKLKIVKKRIRRKSLFLLILTFMATTFSWFIYTNVVSNSIDTRIKSWKVVFKQGDEELENVISFQIDSIYPGMEDYNNSIEIINDGETSATLEYEIISVKILKDTFTKDDYTSEEFISMLSNDYPFKISFAVNKMQLETKDKANFAINVTWPYEQGNDELDTLWGNQAYSYKKNYPDEKQIIIKVKVKAVQS